MSGNESTDLRKTSIKEDGPLLTYLNEKLSWREISLSLDRYNSLKYNTFLFPQRDWACLKLFYYTLYTGIIFIFMYLRHGILFYVSEMGGHTRSLN